MAPLSSYIQIGAIADIPAAGIAGRLYASDDESPPTLYRDNGSTWDAIADLGGGGGGGGTITVEEVDGTPSGAVDTLKLPNGTLAIVGSVATYTPAGGGGTSAQAAVMWHDNAKIVSGNALTIVQDGSQQYNVWSYQATPANGDIFEHYFELASGTYTMEVLGLSANSRGKIDWTIDGAAAVSGQDWYSGGLTYNVRKTASVTIATSGGHTLRGTINGKNAGSSDYQMLITRIAFRP